MTIHDQMMRNSRKARTEIRLIIPFNDEKLAAYAKSIDDQLIADGYLPDDDSVGELLTAWATELAGHAETGYFGGGAVGAPTFKIVRATKPCQLSKGETQ